MSPRKSAKSTPAESAPLQDVGYTIGYENVTVTEAQLTRLKNAQDAAEGMAKYGRFKAWLHYANLQSWQGQGHHFHYLSGEGSMHCTCGMTLYTDGREADLLGLRITDEVAAKLEPLKLSEVQKFRGHRYLPSLSGRTVAITVDYVWEEVSGNYLWSVICQVCGAYQVEVTDSAAQIFEDAHNASCNKKGG